MKLPPAQVGLRRRGPESSGKLRNVVWPFRVGELLDLVEKGGPLDGVLHASEGGRITLDVAPPADPLKSVLRQRFEGSRRRAHIWESAVNVDVVPSAALPWASSPSRGMPHEPRVHCPWVYGVEAQPRRVSEALVELPSQHRNTKFAEPVRVIAGPTSIALQIIEGVDAPHGLRRRIDETPRSRCFDGAQQQRRQQKRRHDVHGQRVLVLVSIC
mmetsp:Transcript_97079/g.274382  ORF Transcript_97079/g.274382 Transcript_97079/m.274382 type:complete len:214 (+) Transcript_97079:45-686(+)